MQNFLEGEAFCTAEDLCFGDPCFETENFAPLGPQAEVINFFIEINFSKERFLTIFISKQI